MASITFPPTWAVVINVSELRTRICLSPLPYTLKPGRPSPGLPSLLRLSIAVNSKVGNITVSHRLHFPSHLRGATHPAPISVAQEPLVFPRGEFFTRIVVTQCQLRTSDTSSKLLITFAGLQNAPYPAYKVCAAAWYPVWSPVLNIFRAGRLD